MSALRDTSRREARHAQHRLGQRAEAQSVQTQLCQSLHVDGELERLGMHERGCVFLYLCRSHRLSRVGTQPAKRTSKGKPSYETGKTERACSLQLALRWR